MEMEEGVGVDYLELKTVYQTVPDLCGVCFSLDL